MEANARLTAYTALGLLPPLVLVSVTGLIAPRLLSAHIWVGLLLVPSVLLKLGSTGYRFVRYYANEPRYRAAGPPQLGMRLLAPFLVLLTVIVFASGIELWRFGDRFGFAWLPIHHASAYLWLVAVGVHTVNYLRRAPALSLADWRDNLSGAATRRGLVVATLLLGAVLAVVMVPYASPFHAGGD